MIGLDSVLSSSSKRRQPLSKNFEAEAALSYFSHLSASSISSTMWAGAGTEITVDFAKNQLSLMMEETV